MGGVVIIGRRWIGLGFWYRGRFQMSAQWSSWCCSGCCLQIHSAAWRPASCPHSTPREGRLAVVELPVSRVFCGLHPCRLSVERREFFHVKE